MLGQAPPTPGGQLSYSKWLHRIPIVVTANHSTKNRALLHEDDFLGNGGNRVLVERVAPPGQRARAS